MVMNWAMAEGSKLLYLYLLDFLLFQLKYWPNVLWSVIDVSGQKFENRGWIHLMIQTGKKHNMSTFIETIPSFWNVSSLSPLMSVCWMVGRLVGLPVIMP